MYSHSRDEGFGAEVKRRILLGTYALCAGYYDAYYLKAQTGAAAAGRGVSARLCRVDAIVTPTAPMPAFKLGEKTDDPLAMYLADIYTVTASLAGICGVTVPCGTTPAGLPVGMQVLAAHLNEGTAFRVARAVESGTGVGSDAGSRGLVQAYRCWRGCWHLPDVCRDAGAGAATPRKPHVVVLGAVKHVPYSKTAIRRERRRRRWT